MSVPTLACFDGVLVEESQARLPVTDEGLLRGDGVFEVMRLYDGRPFAIEQHLARMALSARNLRLELEVEDVRADIATLLEGARPKDGLMRVLATRGGHRIALLEAMPQLPDPIALATLTYAPVRVLDGIKSLSYAANMLSSRLARERGFDEALLISPHGRVLECPTSSFFWIADGELCTTPLSDHVLDSITRRLVLATCEVRELSLARDSIPDLREAFISSSVCEVLAVSRIDEHELDGEGELTRATGEAVRGAIAAELAAG